MICQPWLMLILLTCISVKKLESSTKSCLPVSARMKFFVVIRGIIAAKETQKPFHGL